MLSIHGLTVSYNDHFAVNDVSLQVAPGEVVALIGPNGAGKTTLIRAVSGVIHIDSGAVRSGDKDLTELSNYERARLISVVPQARQIGGAFTVEQTIMLGRTPHMNWLGKPTEKDFMRVQWAMEKTSTSHLRDRRVAELSGGEQQLVLLARALAQETPILLLDEPTNHLDLHHQSRLLNLVCGLAINDQIAVLMAVHDLNLVSSFADRVALLVDGNLVKLGKPGNVLTEGNINNAYNTTVHIITHPDTGIPFILPERK